MPNGHVKGLGGVGRELGRSLEHHTRWGVLVHRIDDEVLPVEFAFGEGLVGDQ
jgi:hypothetical protein